MTGAPLVATPLYGLRTWTVTGEQGAERLSGPYQGAPWPTGGAWLESSCQEGHDPPGPGCTCGVHGWHPRPRAARRILAARREIPGIVEARGAIEVHEDGFRAEQARPRALILAPGRNAALLQRLAEAYDVPVVEARDAQAVLAWCSEHELGLTEPVVAELLGSAELDAHHRTRRAKRRAEALRLAAVLAVVAALVAIGLLAATDPSGRVLQGRTGEVTTR
jgi:hypothetical protein